MSARPRFQAQPRAFVLFFAACYYYFYSLVVFLLLVLAIFPLYYSSPILSAEYLLAINDLSGNSK